MPATALPKPMRPVGGPERIRLRRQGALFSLVMAQGRSAANGDAFSMPRAGVGLGRLGGMVGASLFAGGAAQKPQLGVDPQEIGSVDEHVHRAAADTIIGANHQVAKLPVAALGGGQALG